jgi:hypothetical protein
MASQSRTRLLAPIAIGIIALVATAVLIRDRAPNSSNVSEPRYDLDAIRTIRDSPAPAADTRPLVDAEGVTHALRGRVIDSTAAPVADALVAWFRPSVAEACIAVDSAPARIVRSNEDGRFLLPLPEAGRYMIVVRHARFRTESRECCSTLVADSTADEEVFRLVAGGAIRGRVIARGHGPLSNALVIATACGFSAHPLAHRREAFWGPSINVRQARSGEDGTFWLRGLEEGTYLLTAIAPGMMRVTVGKLRLPIVAKAGDEVEIEVAPAAVLSYQFVDAETGEPIEPHKESNTIDRSKVLDMRRVKETGLWAGGLTQLVGILSPGLRTFVVNLADWPLSKDLTVAVVGRAFGYEDIRAEVPLQGVWGAARIEPVRLRMRRSGPFGKVQLRFIDAKGAPIHGMPIALRLADSEGKFCTKIVARPDQDGSDTISLPTGTYREFDGPRVPANWECSGIVVTARDTARCVLRLRRAYARLTLIFEGKPVELHERVMWKRTVPAGGLLWPLVRDPQTGRGVLGPYDPGQWSVRIFSPLCRPATADFEFEPGLITDLRIPLQRSAGEHWLGQD